MPKTPPRKTATKAKPKKRCSCEDPKCPGRLHAMERELGRLFGGF